MKDRHRNYSIEIKCAACGGVFNPHYGREKTSVVCSVECFSVYRYENPEEVRTAFEKRVNRTSSCWLWTGAKNQNGYGIFRKERAHRISWRLHKGALSDDDVVCHHCDTPDCVNPAHLFVGTQADNVEDMDTKGRRVTKTARGTDHVSAKLTEEDVLFIRASSFTNKQIREMFKISKTLIYRIRNREVWRHI